MTNETATPGRGLFWSGLALCVLGIALFLGQFGLKILAVPWYSPMLATAGAFFLFLSVLNRAGVGRVIAFVLVAAFAGLQWFFLMSLMRLPEYSGSVQVGTSVPTFSATFADGRPFTQSDLSDGSRRAMVFFRGRW